MIKPKVWLVQNGHEKPGYEFKRGRMSLANKALCEEGVRNGAQIEGFMLTASTGPVEAPPTVEKVKASTEKEVLNIAPYRYEPETHQVWEYRDGKKIERFLAEACGHCRYSLVSCWCPQPALVAYDGGGWVNVTIERRHGI